MRRPDFTINELASPAGGVFPALVALVMALAILRLAGVIGWSWWWVTSPLWIVPIGSIALAVAGLFIKGED